MPCLLEFRFLERILSLVEHIPIPRYQEQLGLDRFYWRISG
jgi:hypothetical protein